MEIKKIRNPILGEDQTRFHVNEIPIFDDEEKELLSNKFVEIESNKFLGWEREGIMIVRYNDPNGIDPNNRIYHIYKKEINSDGEFTGIAKCVGLAQSKRNIKNRSGDIIEEVTKTPLGYSSIQEALTEAENHIKK